MAEKKPEIKIKKSKQGSFTSWCKNKGYDGVTQACIAQGKKASPAIQKKAVFAENARKWRKAGA